MANQINTVNQSINYWICMLHHKFIVSYYNDTEAPASHSQPKMRWKRCPLSRRKNSVCDGNMPLSNHFTRVAFACTPETIKSIDRVDRLVDKVKSMDKSLQSYKIRVHLCPSKSTIAFQTLSCMINPFIPSRLANWVLLEKNVNTGESPHHMWPKPTFCVKGRKESTTMQSALVSGAGWTAFDLIGFWSTLA